MPAWEEFLLYFPLFHLNSFILGAVGGIWFVSEAPKRPVNSKTNSAILYGTLALVIFFLLAGWVYPQQVPHYLQTLAGMVSPLSVVIIITLALDKTRLSKVMNHKWLVTLGETSYALYIFHIPVRWWYERLLGYLGINNTAPILEITFLPMMLLIGLLMFLYVDFPLRNQLRNILKRVSMPLLLLDLAAVTLSIYLSFRFRFDTTKEFNAYLPVAYAMFWSAFLIRMVVSIMFKSVSPDILGLPFKQMLYRILFAVTAGSAVAGLLAPAAAKAN
jgi:peptidoglycan/LPS O-acetylase OafA/YrhL